MGQHQYRKYLMQSGQLQKEKESVQINPTTAYGHIRSAQNEDKGGQYPRNDHSEFPSKRVFCPTCRGKFTVDQLKLHMPTCQGHTKTTDAQLSLAQTGLFYTYIRSERNEDDLLKCSHCNYTSKYKNIMWTHGKDAHGISSGSRNAPLKLALPKPVSSASLSPLFGVFKIKQ